MREIAEYKKEKGLKEVAWRPKYFSPHLVFLPMCSWLNGLNGERKFLQKRKKKWEYFSEGSTQNVEVKQ